MYHTVITKMGTFDKFKLVLVYPLLVDNTIAIFIATLFNGKWI